MSGKLEGKVAVTTGGASGIGRASVLRFTEEGCRVITADIQVDLGRQLTDARGEKLAYQHTDVSQEADIEAVIDLALTRFGRLDCMFNNAGMGIPGT